MSAFNTVKAGERVLVGVGDANVLQGNGMLVTHALGSCLGLTIYDPINRIGGMLHAMLPLASINPEKAAANPDMFVDTGAAAILGKIFAAGSRKADLQLRAAGCANPLAAGGEFRIGERNLEVLRKFLHVNGLRLSGMSCGGTTSRTLYFDVATGGVVMQSGGKKGTL
jgi:chemotaxis protein CheD